MADGPPSLGALFWGGFNETRQLMQERSQRLAWEEALPQITAATQENFAPLQEAEAAFQAAATPEEKAKALSQRMTATRDFALRSMDMAARLSASGNPHAQEYGAQLQKGVTEYAQLEMQGSRTMLEQQGQQWDQEFKKRQADAADSRWQTEQGNEQERYLQGRQDRETDLDREARQRSEDMALKRRGMESDIALNQTRAETERMQQERLKDGDRDKKWQTAAIVGEGVAKGQMSPEQAAQYAKENGLEGFLDDKGKFDPGNFPAKFQQHIQDLNNVIETSDDPSIVRDAKAERDEWNKERNSWQRSKIETISKSRTDPGYLRRALDAITGGSPEPTAPELDSETETLPGPLAPRASGRNSLAPAKPPQILDDLMRPPQTDARGRPLR